MLVDTGVFSLPCPFEVTLESHLRPTLLVEGERAVAHNEVLMALEDGLINQGMRDRDQPRDRGELLELLLVDPREEFSLVC